MLPPPMPYARNTGTQLEEVRKWRGLPWELGSILVQETQSHMPTEFECHLKDPARRNEDQLFTVPKLRPSTANKINKYFF